MSTAVIVGTGMTKFGRHLERSLKSLAEEAVRQAMADASVTPEDVGMIFFGNAAGGLLTGQECIRGQVALRDTGLLGKPIVNVENACASSSSAFSLAKMAVESGQYEVAIAVGAEKMYNAQDRMAPMRALEAAADLQELAELKKRIGAEEGNPGSVFMDLYSDLARRFMARTGATAEDYARVAVKSRKHGLLNPNAQFHQDVTVHDVLASKMISEPLTLMMCSPIGDGAAAIVVCSEAYAKKKGLQGVTVRASVVRSGQGGGEGVKPVAQRAAEAAYEAASVAPKDVHVIELHDAAAPAELILYEQLGLVQDASESKHLLASGKTTLGGYVPVNPSGGLMTKGHPIGATGAAQIVELADQLRGRCGKRQREGAKVALAENGGGWIGDDAASAVVTILSV
jgi:acetyl-CoA acetyltransferase